MSSSSVYYKFKSQREPSRVTFDGTSISVWDLKREIILQNKMGKGGDFDLGVYNPDTDEEYRDDSFSISRSSTVIVRRLPPAKPGRGTAQNYVADVHGDGGESSSARPGARGGGGGRDDRQQGPSYRGPMSIRFDDRGKDRDTSSSATPVPQISIPSSLTNGNLGEADSIAAMFQATTDQWDATQEKMSQATFRARGGGPSRGGGPPRTYTPRDSTGTGAAGSGAGTGQEQRPPHAGYVCYRCHKKGHWIQDCPTNMNPEWDNMPRLKRTTGIPKSMLKTVEAPSDEQRRAGVMVTADGTYVVAQVDSATWESTRNQIKPLSRSDVFQSVPSDSTLSCPLCSKLLKNAVQTPCCSTRYCEECIQSHLLEHDFACADCEKRISDLTLLKRDEETRKKVDEYVQDVVGKSEEEVKEREESEAKAKAAREKEEEEEKRKLKEKEEEEGNKEDGNGEIKKEEGGVGDEFNPSSGQQQGINLSSSSSTIIPSNVPVVMFNPQLVQQLVMTLSNPQVPPPMRMMLQTQLQAQQVAFMKMQANNNNGGSSGGFLGGQNGGGGVGMGGGGGMGQTQGQMGFQALQNPFAGGGVGGGGMHQQQQVNGLGMGMNGGGGVGVGVGGGGGGMRMGMGMKGIQNPYGGGGGGGMNPMGMNMGVGVGIGGGGGGTMMMGGGSTRPSMRIVPPSAAPYSAGVGVGVAAGGGMDTTGAYNRGRINQRQGGGGGQKRERDTDFVELGGGGGGGGKMARSG